ncbi:MAG: carbon-nitrogen hydrolase family protein [Gammaproteobacteria bacterium]
MSTVAAIQMCSNHIVDDNLKQAATLLQQAADNGAKLAALPEMFAIMGMQPDDKIAVQESFHHGKIQDFLATQAQKHNMWIVGGTIPLTGECPHKIRAASLMFDNNGQCVARYDKIHLFDAVLTGNEEYKESNTTESGKDLIVVDTPVGKVGLAVCYDVRFPRLFHHLVELGAEIIVLPSAFIYKTGLAHWEILVRALAVQQLCFVIAPDQCGQHTNGRITYGHSMIVDPWGSIMAQQVENIPQAIVADIDRQSVLTARNSLPVHIHKKHCQ